MKAASYSYKDSKFSVCADPNLLPPEQVQLVLGFGSRDLLAEKSSFDRIKEMFPVAQIVLCSTAGEICGNDVSDDSISLSVLQFDSTTVQCEKVNICDFDSSEKAGSALMNLLNPADLTAVLVFSDGSLVNGSELVKGLNSAKKECVLLTGGLAGDATRFQTTLVGLNDYPESGTIVAVGLYGKKLVVSHGSQGGWESFGLERVVTKSTGNELYQIDNQNVLDLYKTYLGKYAGELPGSALLFPLAIYSNQEEEPVVRTILSIDEERNSMIFAGDIPLGSKVRFMRANFDRLIEAADSAAQKCQEMNALLPKYALLISCVGRKVILGNRIEEEVEAVIDVLGKNTVIGGFYSYGEIAPIKPFHEGILHNQTMTITCINELD